MDKQMIRGIAETVAKSIVESLKEYRAAGKSLADVIAAFEKLEPSDKVASERSSL